MAAVSAVSGNPPHDPSAEFSARAAKLGKDAKGWLALADFCEEHLLWDQRLEALRKAVLADPDHAQAHDRLDEKKSGKDWLPVEEASAKENEVNQAKGLVFYGTRWISTKDADKLRVPDQKLLGWPCQIRIDTPHARIYSAQSLEATQQIGALVESGFAAYQRFYGKVWKLRPTPSPLIIQVFEDRKALLDRLGHDALSTTNATGVVGVCRGATGEAEGMIYLGPEAGGGPPPTDAVMKVVIMLGDQLLQPVLSRYDASRKPTQPSGTWLKTGISYHLGQAMLGRQVIPGFAQATSGKSHDMIQVLENGGEEDSLTRLMGLKEADFWKDATRNEAFSWAWIHFLFHGEDGRYAPGFRRFLGGYPDKISAADFESAVGKFSSLEPAFKRYVQDQFLPAVKAAQR